MALFKINVLPVFKAIFLVAQTVKTLPPMLEAHSPGWGDPIEKGLQPTPVFLPAELHRQRRLVAQMVKTLPPMLEAHSPCLVGDPREGAATHPSVLACRTPQTEAPGGLQSTGSQRVRHD